MSSSLFHADGQTGIYVQLKSAAEYISAAVEPVCVMPHNILQSLAFKAELVQARTKLGIH